MQSLPSPKSLSPAAAPPPLHHHSRPRVVASATTYSSTQTSQTYSSSSSSSYLRSPPQYSPSTPCTSLYDVLGLPAGATGQEIKTAYRRLARVCHPDVAAIQQKDSSADDFMRVHAAYSTLSDPEKRAVYDRNLFPARRLRRPFTLSVMTPAYNGYAGRNWETDQCW